MNSTDAADWGPCDGPQHRNNAGHPPADICHDCLPRPCADCGGLDHPSALCACWVDLRDMPLADVKALFAAHDPQMMLGPPG